MHFVQSEKKRAENTVKNNYLHLASFKLCFSGPLGYDVTWNRLGTRDRHHN